MFEQQWIQWPVDGEDHYPNSLIHTQVEWWSRAPRAQGWGECPEFGNRPTEVSFAALPHAYSLILRNVCNLFKSQFALFIWKNGIIMPCIRVDKVANLLCKILWLIYCVSHWNEEEVGNSSWPDLAWQMPYNTIQKCLEHHGITDGSCHRESSWFLL